ncbi:MAG: DNA-binding response regulator [Gammaproteobacteria bacterium]|nr:MAG: DNA-binding response regulator [Gammaproteobacteria bacterium]
MTKRTGLLLVDDDTFFAETLSRALDRRGYSVQVAHDLATARSLIDDQWPDYAILDLRLGDDSGLQVLAELTARRPAARSIVLTGYGSIATAVEAVKRGAWQYLTKPAALADIIAALEGHGPGAEAPPRPLSVRRLEWEHIQKVLAEHGGNISATAKALGMHRRTLQRKLQKRPVKD